MNTVDRMYPRAAAFLAAVVLLGSSCTSDWGKVGQRIFSVGGDMSRV